MITVEGRHIYGGGLPLHHRWKFLWVIIAFSPLHTALLCTVIPLTDITHTHQIYQKQSFQAPNTQTRFLTEYNKPFCVREFSLLPTGKDKCNSVWRCNTMQVIASHACTSSPDPTFDESNGLFFLGPMAAKAVRLASLCCICANSSCCIYFKKKASTLIMIHIMLKVLFTPVSDSSVAPTETMFHSIFPLFLVTFDKFQYSVMLGALWKHCVNNTFYGDHTVVSMQPQQEPCSCFPTS